MPLDPSRRQAAQLPALSRRRAVAALAATSAAAWTTPVVLSFDRLAAASGSHDVPAVDGDAMLGTLAAGESLRPGSVQYSSNSTFYVFEEQSTTLAAPQTTDSGDVLPAGTVICSHLIHWSPATGSTTVSGNVSFSGTIIGYDWSDDTLAATDAQWGIPGVNYGVGRRRMEWPGNDDVVFTLPNSVFLDMFAGAAFVDQIRIYVVY